MTMLLMTLKGIKRMLDKAVDPKVTYDGDKAMGPEETFSGKGPDSPRLIHVDNARDMLEELIKQVEEKPKAPEVDVEAPPEEIVSEDQKAVMGE